MIELLILLVVIGVTVVGPLVWRAVIDRRTEEALKVEARIRAAIHQKLGGETYLVVTVEPGLSGKHGRVSLSAPERWHWLIDEVWKEARDLTPQGYELVVPGEARVKPAPPPPIPFAKAA
ncbi:MAG: hypothetical protein L0027_14290 [Candidatus Rokubacteria bacterium]|nr:hypothetical protein [Candidatus Rokubacteria bacterium]